MQTQLSHHHAFHPLSPPLGARHASRRLVCNVMARTPSSQQSAPPKEQQPARMETPVQLSSLDRHGIDPEKEKSRKFRRVVSAQAGTCNWRCLGGEWVCMVQPWYQGTGVAFPSSQAKAEQHAYLLPYSS